MSKDFYSLVLMIFICSEMHGVLTLLQELKFYKELKLHNVNLTNLSILNELMDRTSTASHQHYEAIPAMAPSFV